MVFSFFFFLWWIDLHQTSALTMWSDEWVINVAVIRSKSISGDPPCSGDPEGKARGSVRWTGWGGGQGPTGSCTCTVVRLTFIVFIDWAGGGAGSGPVLVTNTLLSVHSATYRMTHINLLHLTLLLDQSWIHHPLLSSGRCTKPILLWITSIGYLFKCCSKGWSSMLLRPCQTSEGGGCGGWSAAQHVLTLSLETEVSVRLLVSVGFF